MQSTNNNTCENVPHQIPLTCSRCDTIVIPNSGPTFFPSLMQPEIRFCALWMFTGFNSHYQQGQVSNPAWRRLLESYGRIISPPHLYQPHCCIREGILKCKPSVTQRVSEMPACPNNIATPQLATILLRKLFLCMSKGITTYVHTRGWD